MLLTITQHWTRKSQARYVIEQDGVRTHMLNDASLVWHMENKLSLNKEQVNQVLDEVYGEGKATLELVATAVAAA